MYLMYLMYLTISHVSHVCITFNSIIYEGDQMTSDLLKQTKI